VRRAGEDEAVAHELRVLVLPPGCLDRAELRDALRIAGRLGRLLAERDEFDEVGIRAYREIVVKYAAVADVLGSAAEAYWRCSAAFADGRVVAFTGGFDLARAQNRVG
jgi:hypothetical protein